MIRRWLKEGRKYNFGTDGSKATENFTQMVWQGTQEMGVGRARSEDGKLVLRSGRVQSAGQHSKQICQQCPDACTILKQFCLDPNDILLYFLKVKTRL